MSCVVGRSRHRVCILKAAERLSLLQMEDGYLSHESAASLEVPLLRPGQIRTANVRVPAARGIAPHARAAVPKRVTHIDSWTTENQVRWADIVATVC